VAKRVVDLVDEVDFVDFVDRRPEWTKALCKARGV
jgi:hypothetical protein